MRTFQIPSKFQSGFKIISEIDSEVATSLATILNEYSDVNIKEAISAINKQLPELKENSEDIVHTVYSLLELQNQINEPPNAIIENLSFAFIQSNEDSKIHIDKLKTNLGILIKQSDKQRIAYKAKELLNEFDKVFLNSRVISDVRTIFSENLTDTSQKAIIIHNLKIEYSQNGDKKNLFVALDINDLISLKQQIERAVEKESIFTKEIFLSQVSFISLKNE